MPKLSKGYAIELNPHQLKKVKKLLEETHDSDFIKLRLKNSKIGKVSDNTVIVYTRPKPGVNIFEKCDFEKEDDELIECESDGYVLTVSEKDYKDIMYYRWDPLDPMNRVHVDVTRKNLGRVSKRCFILDKKPKSYGVLTFVSNDFKDTKINA